jgi:WD40 repeat protein
VIWRSFDHRTLRIWGLATSRHVQTLVHAQEGFLCFAFFPDGRRAISGGWHGEVDLWDVETGARLGSTQVHRAEITAAAVLGDGRRVITGDASGGLGVWDVESGAVKLLPHAHEGRVTSLSVTGDGRPLAVSGGVDERVRGWDLTTVTCLSEWTAATAVTTSALGRSAPQAVEQGYRLPAVVTSRTLVAIGNRAGNMSFFEWSP